MAKAIEVFEATLLTPDSTFDRYLKGEDGALNNTEKEGLRLFMSKGCRSCHGGVNLGGTGYFAFGVVERPGAEILPLNDKGRRVYGQTVCCTASVLRRSFLARCAEPVRGASPSLRA